ncbi:multiple myeloma tumor-associated protein 2 homolog [Hydractinia symbiolongicarpus]|uniref:multiple myeloma tumor-associated protein 2 homolog n=1 Tax=Hydractinia symbiolongicarpus TaxID=13093 RepID=UPI00254B7FEA|nr:multiple myeloma tumor-associated protein 2 homolog [Hydractinia symbiolongicarpus]
MAGIFHPSRGGVRGGQDQFKWDDVKTDKDRENYLGHSVMVPVGKWQEGKDLIWYTRDKNNSKKMTAEEKRKEELKNVKNIEARAMAAALGHKSFSMGTTSLTAKELQEVLSRGQTEHSAGDKIQGMGYKKSLQGRKQAKYGTEFEGGRVDNSNSVVTHTEEISVKKRKKEKKTKKKKEKKHKRKYNSSSDEMEQPTSSRRQKDDGRGRGESTSERARHSDGVSSHRKKHEDRYDSRKYKRDENETHEKTYIRHRESVNDQKSRRRDNRHDGSDDERRMRSTYRDGEYDKYKIERTSRAETPYKHSSRHRLDSSYEKAYTRKRRLHDSSDSN